MRAETAVRHMKEGGKNIIRNGWMTFASVSAVTVMLLVVGAFLIMILNINHFADSLENDVEIRVFVEQTAEASETRELEEEILSIGEVESVDFIPREEGLETFITSLGEQEEYFDGLREENPLNDVFTVEAEQPENTQAVADEIASYNNVENVEYGRDIFDQLFAATDFVRTVGAVMIFGLLFTAVFLIANTIKLTIIARKTEIHIMKLVGATNNFIRWPFFIEGLLLGVSGAAIPIIVLSYGYQRFYSAVTQTSGLDFFDFLPASPLLLQTSLLLLAIGALVGVWGSLMSVRKFLQV